MMSTTVFWRTVICGLIATFVMTMISFLQSGAGLPENHLAFFIPKFGPRLVLAGGLVMHLSYGLALALSLKVAGVRGPATVL